MSRRLDLQRDVTDSDVAAVTERLLQRLDAIGDQMVGRYRQEIVDYATADESLLEDVRRVSVDNARALLEDVKEGARVSHDVIERSATAAARRMHQGISLEAFLHAFRVWGQILWNEVLAEARTERPGEREAALQLAGRLMSHVDRVSSAGALSYLDEVQQVWSEGEVLRRDVLELLLSGGDPEAARRLAASVGTELADDYAVVVMHARERGPDESMPATLRERTVLRALVEEARIRLQRRGRQALVGLRHGEVVALCPATGRGEYQEVCGACERLAAAPAASAFAIGIGGLQKGLGGVAVSFAEAREAAVAAAGGEPRAAVAFGDILVRHLLRTSPDADRLLGAVLEPLTAYDAERNSDLLATLRTYIDCGFSPTRSAERLIVHPNTVLYRLGRIRELTGRDPHEPDDLVLLALALKQLDARR
jgi:PucR C-terminal helix-turn-helix domain/GGDEF-like domain